MLTIYLNCLGSKKYLADFHALVAPLRPIRDTSQIPKTLAHLFIVQESDKHSSTTSTRYGTNVRLLLAKNIWFSLKVRKFLRDNGGIRKVEEKFGKLVTGRSKTTDPIIKWPNAVMVKLPDELVQEWKDLTQNKTRNIQITIKLDNDTTDHKQYDVIKIEKQITKPKQAGASEIKEANTKGSNTAHKLNYAKLNQTKKIPRIIVFPISKSPAPNQARRIAVKSKTK